MTNDRAIHLLESMAVDHPQERYQEAINLAIESLPSAEPKTGKCKVCIHWDKLDYEAPRQGWCDQFEDWTDADEYCSRCAKMRGEEE